MATAKYNGPRYFDIAVNLTDRMFHGDYNDKNYHPPDLEAVLERARNFNVRKILITGSSLKESELALNIAKDHQITSRSNISENFLYSTVGVHPCSVTEIEEWELGVDDYLENLRRLALRGKSLGVVKSFGEIGLDYDRLHYASAKLQQKYFEKQLLVACDVDLPLFLHMRAACDDFVKIIEPFLNDTRPDGKSLTEKNGVVHSFTGTRDELEKLLNLGFYIGVNGCSLKTEENLEVVKQIPLEKLLIETDSPWCEIRKSSAAFPLVSSYPNKFYPKFELTDHEELSRPATPAKKNGPNYKFDNFLPIPSIKRDQYSTFVQQLEGKEVMPIGINSQPLIKSRNEPCFIGYVAEIVSKLHGVDPEVVIETCWNNSCRLFNIE